MALSVAIVARPASARHSSYLAVGPSPAWDPSPSSRREPAASQRQRNCVPLDRIKLEPVTTGLWGRRAHIPTAEMYEVGQLCFMRLEQDRADEVIELMQRLAPVYPAVPSIRCMLAQACAEAGRTGEAHEYLRSMARDEAARR